MEVLIFSFNVMAPVILIVTLGWFLTWRGVIEESFIGPLNKLCFNVFLPLMLFNNIYQIDFQAEFHPGLVGYSVLCVLATLALLTLLLPLYYKDRGMRAATLNATFRSNFIIYAQPILFSMFGDAGRRASAMLVPIAVCMYNFFGVIIMCYYSGDPNQGKLALLKHTAKDIVRHPLIIASVGGILFACTPLPMPVFLGDTLSMIGAVGTPVGLLLLGAQLDLKTMRGNLGGVLLGSFIRLAALPAVGTGIAIALGFRGVELGTIFLLLGTPCPVTAAVMARNYNMAPRFAAQLVVMSTALSAVSIFCGISLLRGFSLV